MSILRIGRYALRTKRGKKLLSAAQKLLRRKEAAKEYRKVFKSVHAERLYVKGKRTLAKSKEFKQKPLKGSPQGPDIITQQSTHYGPRGVELKIKSRKARATSWIGAESWRNEMARMYGGVHMSQTKEGAKKSVNILAKEYKKRFKKKKVKKLLAGGLLYPGIRVAVKYARPLWKVASKKVYDRAGKTAMAKLQIKLNKARDLEANFSKIQLKDLTSSQIKEMGKFLPKLKAYKTRIKDIATAWIQKEYRFGKKKKVLHSEGGEVVIGKNVDRSLL